LDVQYDIRTTIYRHLQRLDFARHDEMQTGQLVSRASSDVGLLQGLLAFLPIMSGNVLLVIGSLGVMLWYSPLLTVVSLVAVPLLAGWLALHHRISIGTFLAFSTYLLQLVAPARMLAGLLTVGQQARAGAERILELLDSVPVVTEVSGAQPLQPVHGDVD